MTTPPKPTEVAVRGIDRFLALAALGLAIAAVLCFFAIIIGTALGMQQAEFGVGLWPIIGAIPVWGLPLALLMILALLTMSFVRKGRATRGS